MGIAKELFLSSRTVEAYVTNIFIKLELNQVETDNNRVRAVLAYLRSAAGGAAGGGAAGGDAAGGQT